MWQCYMHTITDLQIFNSLNIDYKGTLHAFKITKLDIVCHKNALTELPLLRCEEFSFNFLVIYISDS